MAEQRYRFGGPIPESVQKLKSRREYRASSLYAGLRKIRRERSISTVDASDTSVGLDAPSPTASAPDEERALPQATLIPSGLL